MSPYYQDDAVTPEDEDWGDRWENLPDAPPLVYRIDTEEWRQRADGFTPTLDFLRLLDEIDKVRLELGEEKARVRELEAEIQAWKDARDEGVYL
jgi:hypothetical protein